MVKIVENRFPMKWSQFLEELSSFAIKIDRQHMEPANFNENDNNF